jgi:hypothetical protein
MISDMPIVITLVDSNDKRIRGIPDPWGSFFDAAGHFDRLVGEAPALPIWNSLDPDALVLIDRDGAKQLIEELPTILAKARPGLESRGLERLRILAQICASSEALHLVARGD